MAAVMSMVELIDNYTKGRGWKWGECDCIGLLFHCVNFHSAAPQIRSDHIPYMDYEESVKWLLRRYPDPVAPYVRMMQDARLRPPRTKIEPQIMFVYGGGPLKAIGVDEWYPVEPVPGIVFQPSAGSQVALMRGGLRSVSVQEDGRRIFRFGLTGD